MRPMTSTSADFMSVPMANVRKISLPPAFALPIDFLHARQALQHPLLRLEQLGLDFLGRRAAPVGEDRDRRPLDIGKQLQEATASGLSAPNRHTSSTVTPIAIGFRIELAMMRTADSLMSLPTF